MYMGSSTLFGFLFIIGITAFIYGEMSRKLQQDILLRQQIREDKREARQQLLDQQQQMFDERQAEREQRQEDREERFQERMAEKRHRDYIMLDAIANRPYGYRTRRRRRPFIRPINNIRIIEKNRIDRERERKNRQIARNTNRDANRAMRREIRRRVGSEGFASYQSGTIN
jgi:glutamate synthase domain-containing protein 3